MARRLPPSRGRAKKTAKKKTRPAVTAGSDQAANKRLVRRWFNEVWNKQRGAAIAEMFAATGIAHGKSADGGPAHGPGAFEAFHQAYLNAFPDLNVRVDDVIAEGRKVAVRWTATGTHNGDGLGFDATQKPMQMTGMTFVVIRNGMIAEGWDNYDSLGMFQQLGVTGAPTGARNP